MDGLLTGILDGVGMMIGAGPLLHKGYVGKSGLASDLGMTCVVALGHRLAHKDAASSSGQ